MADILNDALEGMVDAGSRQEATVEDGRPRESEFMRMMSGDVALL